jgi:hypothetical protein
MTTPRRVLTWAIALAAAGVDGSSIAAELLVSRCIAAQGIEVFAMRWWQDHFVAFPWTTASMVWMCVVPGLPRWIAVGARLLLMSAVMWPACELARLVADWVWPQWTAVAYALTMVITSMVAVDCRAFWRRHRAVGPDADSACKTTPRWPDRPMMLARPRDLQGKHHELE